MTIHYEANGTDDFDPVEVEEAPQIAYPLENGAEIEAAAAALDEEDGNDCEFCEGTGKVENARGFMVPCQECSVDYDADKDN